MNENTQITNLMHYIVWSKLKILWDESGGSLYIGQKHIQLNDYCWKVYVFTIIKTTLNCKIVKREKVEKKTIMDAYIERTLTYNPHSVCNWQVNCSLCIIVQNTRQIHNKTMIQKFKALLLSYSPLKIFEIHRFTVCKLALHP